MKYYSNIGMLCLSWLTNLAHIITMIKIIFNLLWNINYNANGYEFKR